MDFANFYQRFLNRFSRIAALFTTTFQENPKTQNKYDHKFDEIYKNEVNNSFIAIYKRNNRSDKRI